MPTIPQPLPELLPAKLELLRELCERYGVEKLELFGSAARVSLIRPTAMRLRLLDARDAIASIHDFINNLTLDDFWEVTWCRLP